MTGGIGLLPGWEGMSEGQWGRINENKKRGAHRERGQRPGRAKPPEVTRMLSASLCLYLVPHALNFANAVLCI